jgi:peptidoglycan L-alanyl-D-glutamate endopeptidase CwlK
MASRSTDDMTPALYSRYLLMREKADKAGIPFILTSVSRFVKEQFALYAQGRQPLIEVNRLRGMAGMVPIPASDNIIVTWTLQSNHLIDLDDGNPKNDKSRAFDIAVVKDGRAIYDLKVNINANDLPDYLELANIGESVGLISGSKFKKPDYPHYEYVGE